MNYKIFCIIILTLIAHSELRSEWELIDKSKLYRDGSTTGYHWNYIDLDCADENNCIALVEANTRWPWNKITSDGGKTWYSSNMDTTILKVNENNEVIWTNDGVLRPKRVCYPDTSLCIVTADSGYYYKSTDKGLTWERNYLPSEKNLNLVNFIDNNNGVIYSNKQLYITKDCFESYEIQDLFRPDPGEITYIEDMKVVGEKTIIILAYNKLKIDFILRSDDWGETWQYYPTIEPRVSEIYFIDPLVGWAVGSPRYNEYWRRDVILHTTDGGQSWQSQLDTMVISKSGLNGIDFWDDQNGIAYGWASKLWRTSNAGKTWIHDTSSNIDRFGDMVNIFKMIGKKDLIGCAAEKNDIWKYSDEASDLFKNEPYIPKTKKLILYPNPSDGSEIHIDIALNNSTKCKIAIFNIVGEKVTNDFDGFIAQNQIVKLTFDIELFSG